KENPRPTGRSTFLTRYTRYTGERARAATAEQCQLAKELGLTPTELAPQFVTQQPLVTSNLIGATNMAQLKENIGSLACDYNDAIAQAIEEIFQRYPNPAP